MPYLAEMLGGQIEMVDLENPMTPMTTCGEQDPIFFRLAHSIISIDDTYICDQKVLINMTLQEPRHAEEAHAVEERL